MSTSGNKRAKKWHQIETLHLKALDIGGCVSNDTLATVHDRKYKIDN